MWSSITLHVECWSAADRRSSAVGRGRRWSAVGGVDGGLRGDGIRRAAPALFGAIASELGVSEGARDSEDAVDAAAVRPEAPGGLDAGRLVVVRAVVRRGQERRSTAFRDEETPGVADVRRDDATASRKAARTANLSAIWSSSNRNRSAVDIVLFAVLAVGGDRAVARAGDDPAACVCVGVTV